MVEASLPLASVARDERFSWGSKTSHSSLFDCALSYVSAYLLIVRCIRTIGILGSMFLAFSSRRECKYYARRIFARFHAALVGIFDHVI